MHACMATKYKVQCITLFLRGLSTYITIKAYILLYNFYDLRHTEDLYNRAQIVYFFSVFGELLNGPRPISTFGGFPFW